MSTTYYRIIFKVLKDDVTSGELAAQGAERASVSQVAISTRYQQRRIRFISYVE